jgi:phenylpropionate dioxygenase-like ring-hydroxylating dioxygenase large terminal subunit
MSVLTVARNCWKARVTRLELAAPTHSWTYALDGQLIGPPSPNFNKSDYRLAPVRSETWDTNWKCLVDNFMDTMHIHRVHK